MRNCRQAGIGLHASDSFFATLAREGEKEMFKYNTQIIIMLPSARQETTRQGKLSRVGRITE